MNTQQASTTLQRLRGCPVWLLVLMLSGCTLLPNEAAELKIFDLHAPAAAMAGTRDADAWQLAVEAPTARAPMAGIRIAVREQDGSYAVLSGARWSLAAPQLLQAVLIEAFEASGRLSGVGPLESMRGDCRLGGELRAFHWDAARGRVEVVLAARLHCGAGEAVVGQRVFTAGAAVKGQGAAAVVAGFDTALAELAPALVTWVLASGPE